MNPSLCIIAFVEFTKFIKVQVTVEKLLMNLNRERNEKFRTASSYLKWTCRNWGLILRCCDGMCQPPVGGGQQLRQHVDVFTVQHVRIHPVIKENLKSKTITFCLKLTKHWVSLTSSVTTSTRLYRGRFLCIKIMDCSVEKFGYNKHQLITTSFFWIFSLSVSEIRVMFSLFVSSEFYLHVKWNWNLLEK